MKRSRSWLGASEIIPAILLVLVILTVICFQVFYTAPLRETCLHGPADERMEACRDCAFFDPVCKLEYQHGKD